MENSIKINSSKLPIREYNGQRVVTFKDIDAVHGRPEGTARKRFNDNKKHFTKGFDYFKVKCSEVRPFFGQTPLNGFNPNADLILLTESGYLMLAKSFTDDLAWKVQRELVNNYFRGKTHEPEQLTLETSEYHYFHKTFKGEPVITVADFVHFTEISANSVYKILPKNCIIGTDYERLEYRELAKFKAENHIPLKRMGNTLIVLRKSGIDKLMKFYNLNVWIPMAIRASQPPVVKPMTADEILNARKITRDDCIIALDVLRRIESNCENNVKMAAREGRSTQFYGQELSEVKNVIKGVGMLLVMGY